MEKIVVILVLVLTACSSAPKTPTPGSMNPQPASVGEGQAFVGGNQPDGGSAQPDGRIPEGFVDGSSPMLDGSMVDAAVQGPDAGQGGSDAASQDSGSGQDSGVGSDAGQDAGSDAMVPVCPGSGPGTKCEGLTRFACVSGQWAEQETCAHVCQAGACVGVCNPGAKDCSSGSPRTCNSNGQWVSGVACSFVCSAGDCVGACVPGDRDCSGLTPRHCDATGQWVSENACQYVCSGLGACSGSCVPNAVDCQSNVPRSCDSNGNWQSGSACQFACSGGSCGGVCVPNAKRCNGLGSETCDASGQWQSSSTCPFVCSGAGVCSGSCVPGSHQCSGNGSQTCDSNGNWQSPQSCPYVCDSSSGTCGGVCVPSSQKCSGAQIQVCASNGQWGSASNCPAVTGATVACNAVSNTCKATCTGSHFDCNNNMADGCEADVSNDSANCGVCGHSCCGGACGGGTCGVYDSGITPSVCGPSSQANPGAACFTVDASNVYWSTGTGISKTPRLGGSPSVLVPVRIDAGSGQNWNYLRGLTIQGGTLFWAEDPTTGASHVSWIPTQGGSIQSVNGSAGMRMKVTATDILYARDDRASVQYTNWASGVSSYAMAGASTNTYSDEIATDGTYVYAARTKWTSNQVPITRAPVEGGTETPFVTYVPTPSTAASSFAHLTTDGVNLYYVMYVGAEPAKTGIWKKPLSGGAATQLVTDGSANYLATDGVNVYYATGASSNTIKKVSINGGSSVVLTASFGASDTLQIVNECLYALSGTVKAIAVNP